MEENIEALPVHLKKNLPCILHCERMADNLRGMADNFLTSLLSAIHNYVDLQQLVYYSGLPNSGFAFLEQSRPFSLRLLRCWPRVQGGKAQYRRAKQSVGDHLPRIS
jgi:hypothetical protein